MIFTDAIFATTLDEKKNLSNTHLWFNSGKSYVYLMCNFSRSFVPDSVASSENHGSLSVFYEESGSHVKLVVIWLPSDLEATNVFVRRLGHFVTAEQLSFVQPSFSRVQIGYLCPVQ